MNINPLSLCAIKYPNNNHDKQIRHNNNFLLLQDTVSFSGKTKKTQNANNHEKNGVNFGKEVLLLLENNCSSDEILKRLNQVASNLTIEDISGLNRFGINPTAYRAYFSSHFKDEFKPKEMHLFLSLNDKLDTKEDKLLLAMDIAHEYTHYSQTSSGDDYEQLSKITNGDVSYAAVLTALGDYVFSYFDTFLNITYTSYIFNDATLNQNSLPIPKEAYISRQDILKSAKIKNEAAFKKEIESAFDKQFVKLIHTIVDNVQNHPERVDVEILIHLDKVFESGETEINKLKEDIRKYCRLQARREKEARSAESTLAKKVMKTSGAINYDVFPVYYEMLEKAFG